MTKVLCIEDRVALLKNLEERLEQAGYDVIGVTHVDDAIKAFENERPDIITLDYRLGIEQRNGLDFLRELGDKRGSIPVIMLSATALDTIKKENPDFDSFGLTFLTKQNSFHIGDTDLLSTVKKMLEATRPSINSKEGGTSIT